MAEINNQSVDIDKKAIESLLLNRSLETDGLVYKKILKIDVQPGAGAADNGASTILRVNLQLETNSNDIVNKSIMYKSKRRETSGRDLTEEFNLFRTEIMIYDNVLKKMTELRRCCGDFSDDLYPICYGFETNLILMEDLQEKGFKMLKASQGMDMEHARMVISSMSKFHALSMKLIKDKTLDKKSLAPWWLHRNLPLVDNMFKGGITTLADVIEQHWGHEWNDVAKRLRKAGEQLSYKLMILSEETKNRNLDVLNHGDCWSNNIMFNYKDDGTLNSMRFIDFQASHFNSLCWDLTYFIYNCIFPDKRQEWINSLIDYYCEMLKANCVMYGLMGPIPSRQEIQTDMDNILYFAFINSISNIPVFIAMDLPDFEFDMDNLACDDTEQSPVSHQSRYYKTQRVTELMKKDLQYFISKNVI